MLRLALILLVGACANVQPGIPDESDIDCGVTANVDVRLRRHVLAFPPLTSCAEARAELERQRVALRSEWELLETCGYPGIDERGDPVRGRTWPETHVIEINVAGEHERALKHELLHAQDFEQGRPNTRD